MNESFYAFAAGVLSATYFLLLTLGLNLTKVQLQNSELRSRLQKAERDRDAALHAWDRLRNYGDEE